MSMPSPAPVPAPAAPQGLSLGGILTAVSQSELDKASKAAAEQANSQPMVQGLAAHIRRAWEINEQEKDPIETRMLGALRQRRGEYDPERLAKIREQGGSEIFMMISAAKARTISAWMRDILMSKGTEKPWTLDPTPLPELPPDRVQGVFAELQGTLQQMAMQGVALGEAQTRQILETRKADLLSEMKDEARRTATRMESYMEDQLIEGGFMRALSQALDDLTTFPAMILKGPVVRSRRKLQWGPGPDGGWALTETDELRAEWERVDPFHLYPAPNAESVDDGDLIEFHRLSRADLQSLIGVEGYSEDAIRAVLDEHGRGGLMSWTSLDSERAQAEGRDSNTTNPSKLIEALQYWGSVQGTELIDWGMDEAQVEDRLAEYEVEAWLIGRWVIKAVINPDPLGRRPYYNTSWEKIPGTFWGNSPMDQLKDCQAMCNAAARALANNMGISSGPQVWANIDRMPPGEDITNLYPWKIWQTTSDQTGGSSAPLGFFQPQSNAAELMAIYDKFTAIADDVVGVPRYMGGEAPGGGIGRTATGMDMIMQHAGKAMQQAVGLIDLDIITPLLERLYYYNMKYAEDQSIKGDVKVRARGANSLVAKASAQQRRNEFLQLTNNPTDLQITGLEGRATVLREQAKSLDLNADRIVADPDVLKVRQQLMALSAGNPQGPQPGQGQPQGANPGSGQQLPNGTPTTDNFNTPPNS